MEVSSGVPQGTDYVIDGTRTAAVVRQDGSVEADRSVGFRNDITVVRVVGRFGFAFAYTAAATRIIDKSLTRRREGGRGTSVPISPW